MIRDFLIVRENEHHLQHGWHPFECPLPLPTIFIAIHLYILLEVMQKILNPHRPTLVHPLFFPLYQAILSVVHSQLEIAKIHPLQFRYMKIIYQFAHV